MGKKLYIVRLEEQDRLELERISHSCKTDGRKALHCRVLLSADQGPAGPGWKDEQIGEAYGVSDTTIERIRKRYVTEGLDRALCRKATSRVYRKKIEGEEEAHLIALTCSEPPEGHAHWTMQLLADKLVELKLVESVSDETIRRTLKKTNSSRGRRKNGAFRPRKTRPSSARWKSS